MRKECDLNNLGSKPQKAMQSFNLEVKKLLETGDLSMNLNKGPLSQPLSDIKLNKASYGQYGLICLCITMSNGLFVLLFLNDVI